MTRVFELFTAIHKVLQFSICNWTRVQVEKYAVVLMRFCFQGSISQTLWDNVQMYQPIAIGEKTPFSLRNTHPNLLVAFLHNFCFLCHVLVKSNINLLAAFWIVVLNVVSTVEFFGLCDTFNSVKIKLFVCSCMLLFLITLSFYENSKVCVCNYIFKQMRKVCWTPKRDPRPTWPTHWETLL